MFYSLTYKWLCGKCIVGQSSAKFDKVDMFSKQAIKKQSWQSWCIFLSIFKNIMQSKVGKVEMWIHYSRQSWQSSDLYISNNGQSSYPRQSWQSWKYFWTNLASLYNRQSWQSSDITFLIMGKVQTQGKVSKVENTFGLFSFFLD